MSAASRVVVVEETGREECECDHRSTEPHEDGRPAREEPRYPDRAEANDVFIVEGTQERYGSKRTWELCG